MTNSLLRAVFGEGNESSPFLNLESTSMLGLTGMRHRLLLPKDDGVLFDFGVEADHAFWMDSVKIPLDIIFISRAGKVVHIHENAAPNSKNSITSGIHVSTVIEANGGWYEANGVTVGTFVQFQGLGI